MEKNITLGNGGVGTGNSTISMRDVANDIVKAAKTPLEWLRRYYSQVLEHEVSTRQTLRYLHAQLAFVMAVFPDYESMLLHVAVAAWFVVALLECRE